MNSTKLIYPDTGVLDATMGLKPPVPARLTDGLNEGRYKLAISELHMHETMKTEDEALIRSHFEYFEAQGKAGRLVWMTSYGLLRPRELGHFQGTLYAPEEERAFVDTFGHITVESPAAGRATSRGGASPLEYYERIFTPNHAHRTAVAAYNAALDLYQAKLEAARTIYSEGNAETVSFPDWIESALRTPVVEIETVARRLKEMKLSNIQKRLPACWAMYALEKAIVVGQERFDSGDIRDMLHANYLAYVDVFVADRRFSNRIADAELPSAWKTRVVKNGDVLHDRSWEPSQ